MDEVGVIDVDVDVDVKLGVLNVGVAELGVTKTVVGEAGGARRLNSE